MAFRTSSLRQTTFNNLIFLPQSMRLDKNPNSKCAKKEMWEKTPRKCVSFVRARARTHQKPKHVRFHSSTPPVAIEWSVPSLFYWGDIFRRLANFAFFFSFYRWSSEFGFNKYLYEISRIRCSHSHRECSIAAYRPFHRLMAAVSSLCFAHSCQRRLQTQNQHKLGTQTKCLAWSRRNYVNSCLPDFC